jgi:FkbM family methyltransferase
LSWRTNEIILAARNVGRKLGLNDAIAAALGRDGYEARYDSAFAGEIVTGDCIWDVGANVGYYTRQFSAKAGSQGYVYAFEPSPANYAKLTAGCVDLTNVTTHQFALGRESSSLPFLQGADALGATSRIVIGGTEAAVLVDVRTAASILAADLAKRPNAIKIDVEGFELEVLQGFGEMLTDQSLRAIGVEVHFAILQSRGVGDAPAWIERELTQSGFSVSWPDASHILAVRRHA